MSVSRSSRALDELLMEEEGEAEAVRREFHRTMLWRYRKGLGKPSTAVAAKIERLSNKRVPANGWEDEPAEDSASATPTPSTPPEQVA